MTLRATTRPTTCPMCCTVSRAKMGSSPAKDASMPWPAISCASTTATTPGMARAARASTPLSLPWATVDRMGAACSVPCSSGMSSMKVAAPATWARALSCGASRPLAGKAAARTLLRACGALMLATPGPFGGCRWPFGPGFPARSARANCPAPGGGSRRWHACRRWAQTRRAACPWRRVP